MRKPDYIMLSAEVPFLTLISGVFLLSGQKHWGVKKVLIVAVVTLFFIFSFRPITNLSLYLLENRYPPIASEEIDKTEKVVLLSGGGRWVSNFPILSQLNRSSTTRLYEAVRLLQLNPKAILIITGGPVSPKRHDIAVSSVMAEAAVSLGVPRYKITCEMRSKNTYENALHVYKYVEKKPFVLVTSAFHMPRAMAVFNALGMKPVPAPTDYRPINTYLAASKKGPYSLGFWLNSLAMTLPTVQSLEDFTCVVHEWVGFLWYKIRYKDLLLKMDLCSLCARIC